MSFTAEKVIEFAYFLSNINSATINQSVTTIQSNQALSLLNGILDRYSNNIAYQVFPEELTTTVATRNLFIGESLSSSDPSVTILDAPYLSFLTNASVLVTSENISMTVLPMNQRFNRSFTNISTIPARTYWINRKDSNENPFTHIYIDPINNQGFTITLFGRQSISSNFLTSSTVFPSYYNHLLYELASQLADINGKTDQWDNKKEAKRLRFEKDIINKVSIDTSFNNDGAIVFGNRGNATLIDSTA